MRAKRSLCMILLLALWLSGCTPRGNNPATLATAQLMVAANPAGARVTVDGAVSGSSPLTVTLPAGEHRVVLSADGFAPISTTIQLAAGQTANYSPSLQDLVAPKVRLVADKSEVPWDGQILLQATATDNGQVASVELLLDGEQIAADDTATLSYELVPADTAGLTPDSRHVLTARATDASGNVAEQTLELRVGPMSAQASGQAQPTGQSGGAAPASATPSLRSRASPAPSPAWTPAPPTDAPALPTPQPTSPSPARTELRVGEITIPTYPYAAYLSTTSDPSVGDYPVQVLNRAAYDASNPSPAPKTYRKVVLENTYLRLSILPDLGGRLYECVFKPTGNNEFYSNPVIKPTKWGPGNPPYPAGANWWLAAGGMEWGFPVEEHGYEWATSWGQDHATLPDGSVMVSVFTRDPKRPYAVVDIILPPDTAYFIVRPRIRNSWGSTFRFKWWHDAMLAPGAANAPGPDLRFIMPASEMTVHSTGDASLPAAGQPLSWPIYQGRDLSRLGNWNQYLGFFERPSAQNGFMGVYDPVADEGMVRVYPSDEARGAKVFAMGWNSPPDWSNWTDDGSGYVELQSGLAPTFDDWYELPPGGEVTWSEVWYPVAGLGGLTYASDAAALNIEGVPGSGKVRVGVFPTRDVRGQLTIALPGMAPVTQDVTISPAAPFAGEFAYDDSLPDEGEVSVTLTDADGTEVLAYRATVRLR